MTPKRPQVNSYLKYSGLAIQFFVLMAIAAWLGQYLDKKVGSSESYFTIALILLFATGFFYSLIKDLNRRDEP